MTAINLSSKRDYDSLARLPAPEQYLAFPDVSENVRRNAALVVMVVRARDLVYDPTQDTYQLNAAPLHKRSISPGTQLAENFPYRNALSCYSLGSGFFIQQHLIVTAAHVLFSSREHLALKDIRFIQGLYQSDNLQSIQARQIFRPAKGQVMKELPHEISMTGADWAMIEVRSLADDNTAYSLPEFHFDTSPQLRGQRIYGIGHGLGTTLKISNPKSYILKDDRRQPYFEGNLPLFVSSSGSPVFNADNHKLIGMLIRATNQLQRINNQIFIKHMSEEEDYRRPLWQEGQECQRLTPFAIHIKEW